MTLHPGGKFGDYTVLRLLGRGGMGEVWLIRSASWNHVAAKILDPEIADAAARKRFLREAQLALGVKHPNLVETYDVGEDPETGLCYILMEYVPGGTLSSRIRKEGAFAVEDAVAVVRAMASVLELGRRKGIVHRDIKPANIMFTAAGTPKLADLGIARAGRTDVETTTVTQTGVMIGTPAYMSPEQMLDSHNVDTRADIYSLGVVFFEMLTGERPNKGDTVVQLLAKAMSGVPLPDVRTVRPDVPEPIAHLLGIMVMPDKNDRIATPGQITSALAVITRGGTFVPAKRPPEKVVRTQNPAVRVKRRFPWTILILVLLFAAAAAIYRGPLLKQMITAWQMGRHSLPATVVDPVETNAVFWTEEDAPVAETNAIEKAEDVTVAVPLPETNRAERSETVARAAIPVETNRVERIETESPAVVPAETNRVERIETEPPAVVPAETNRVERKRPEPHVEVSVPTNKPVARLETPAVTSNVVQRAAPVETNRPVIVAKPRKDVRSPKKVREFFYECEVTPYFKDASGDVRYPSKIDSCDVTGGLVTEVGKNARGNWCVAVLSRERVRGIRFLTIRAEGKSQTVPFQLMSKIRKTIEVNMSGEE